MASIDDVRVSDHVIIRWLERVRGVDVEAIRREILAEAGPAAAMGAKTVRKAGRTFVIERGCIVTVLHGDRQRPPRRR
jgi:hypothetical protein